MGLGLQFYIVCRENQSHASTQQMMFQLLTYVTLGFLKLEKSESKTYTVSFGFDANDKF